MTDRAVRHLLLATTFLGATLLFWLEPLVGKELLPVLGGAAAVWNTCLVFFQAMLLAGYLWAHLLTTRFSPRHQGLVQGGLALVSLAATVGLTTLDAPPPDASPVPWLIGALTLTIGAPFFVLSATSPLLQRWSSLLSDRDPYRLAVASNAGSLVALLAFPLVFEPFLPLGVQRTWWRVGHVVFVVLLAVCAWMLSRRTTTAPAVPGDAGLSSDAEPAPSWKRRLHWLLLSAAPSSLLAGATSYVTTDLAAVPLLWMVPLALYLLTFVLAFGASGDGAVRRFVPLLVGSTVLTLVLVADDRGEAVHVLLVVHLMNLFLAARVCHGALAADRPAPRHLTAFFAWVSLGGLVGGLFNALVAPLLFDTNPEYPIAVLACCALAPWSKAFSGKRVLVVGGCCAVLLPAAWLLLRGSPGAEVAGAVLLYVVPLVAAVAYRARPALFALAVGPLLLLVMVTGSTQRVDLSLRTFYGINRVADYEVSSGKYALLFHGTTRHGMQRIDGTDEDRRTPLLYFHPAGPVGEAFRALDASTPRTAGIVGLGVGCLASYARPEDRFVFYELDPGVLSIARDSGRFHFLRDAKGKVEHVLGDARRTLAASTERFDLLVIDAFSSDSVPVHLLTREAVRDVYLPRIAERGWLLLHLSNRYLDMKSVAAAVARDLGLHAAYGYDPVDDPELVRAASQWMVLTRDAATLDALTAQDHWEPLDPGTAAVEAWTDDFSNLVSALVRKMRGRAERAP